MELLGKGEPVPYDRCVRASTGSGAVALRSGGQARARRRVAGPAGASVVERRGTARGGGRLAPREDGADGLGPRPRRGLHRPLRRASAWRTSCPTCRLELRDVPRANIRFLPIQGAWFSGSMNYLGRARRADGSPEYEATYEINASLEISVRRVRATGEPRGGARPRDHLRLSAEPLRAQAGRFRGLRAHHEHARGRALRGHRQQRHPHGARRHGSGRTAGRGSPDRGAAGPAAGRRQEPVVLSHLEGGRPAGRGGRRPAPRLPGDAGARRQALRRLGPAPAARAHVPAGLPRGHGVRGGSAPPLSARAAAARALRLFRSGGCDAPSARRSAESLHPVRRRRIQCNHEDVMLVGCYDFLGATMFGSCQYSGLHHGLDRRQAGAACRITRARWRWW